MILCHKCSGVLAGEAQEIKGLNGCGCISSYYHGFEPAVTRKEAITIQIAAIQQRRRLYLDQKRDQSFFDHCNANIDALDALRK